MYAKLRKNKDTAKCFRDFLANTPFLKGGGASRKKLLAVAKAPKYGNARKTGTAGYKDVRFGHLKKGTIRLMYLPMMSNSRLTTEPGFMLWKLVFSYV